MAAYYLRLIHMTRILSYIVVYLEKETSKLYFYCHLFKKILYIVPTILLYLYFIYCVKELVLQHMHSKDKMLISSDGNIVEDEYMC